MVERLHTELRRQLASDRSSVTTAAFLRFLFGQRTGRGLPWVLPSALEQGSHDLPGTPALATWMFVAACLVALFPDVPGSMKRRPRRYVMTTLLVAGAWIVFWHAWPVFLGLINNVIPLPQQTAAAFLLFSGIIAFVTSLLYTGGIRILRRLPKMLVASGLNGLADHTYPATNTFDAHRYDRNRGKYYKRSWSNCNSAPGKHTCALPPPRTIHLQRTPAYPVPKCSATSKKRAKNNPTVIATCLDCKHSPTASAVKCTGCRHSAPAAVITYMGNANKEFGVSSRFPREPKSASLARSVVHVKSSRKRRQKRRSPERRCKTGKLAPGGTEWTTSPVNWTCPDAEAQTTMHCLKAKNVTPKIVQSSQEKLPFVTFNTPDEQVDVLPLDSSCANKNTSNASTDTVNPKALKVRRNKATSTENSIVRMRDETTSTSSETAVSRSMPPAPPAPPPLPPPSPPPPPPPRYTPPSCKRRRLNSQSVDSLYGYPCCFGRLTRERSSSPDMRRRTRRDQSKWTQSRHRRSRSRSPILLNIRVDGDVSSGTDTEHTGRKRRHKTMYFKPRPLTSPSSPPPSYVPPAPAMQPAAYSPYMSYGQPRYVSPYYVTPQESFPAQVSASSYTPPYVYCLPSQVGTA